MSAQVERSVEFPSSSQQYAERPLGITHSNYHDTEQGQLWNTPALKTESLLKLFLKPRLTPVVEMISSEALRPTPNPARKGKLASRLEEVKNPWRTGSTLELSHNETARLATDALLEQGEKEYKKVLHDEREVNFLSSLEIRYITEYVAKSSGADSGINGVDMEEDTMSELTSGTYFPMMSDEEPPMLELGWPEASNRCGPTEAQIFFQRDKSQNVKDLIRSLISKAKKVRTTETHLYHRKIYKTFGQCCFLTCG